MLRRRVLCRIQPVDEFPFIVPQSSEFLINAELVGISVNDSESIIFGDSIAALEDALLEEELNLVATSLKTSRPRQLAAVVSKILDTVLFVLGEYFLTFRAWT